MTHARIVDGEVIELVAVPSGLVIADLLHPDLVAQCVPVPPGLVGQVAQRWTWSEAGGFAPPA